MNAGFAALNIYIFVLNGPTNYIFTTHFFSEDIWKFSRWEVTSPFKLSPGLIDCSWTYRIFIGRLYRSPKDVFWLHFNSGLWDIVWLFEAKTSRPWRQQDSQQTSINVNYFLYMFQHKCLCLEFCAFTCATSLQTYTHSHSSSLCNGCPLRHRVMPEAALQLYGVVCMLLFITVYSVGASVCCNKQFSRSYCR